MKKDIFILLAISLVTSVYVLANSDTDSLYRKSTRVRHRIATGKGVPPPR